MRLKRKVKISSDVGLRGQSFLKGFLTHVGGDHVSVVTQTDAAAKTFETVARQLGETREIRASTLRGQKGFTDAGAIFFPAPGYMDAAWRRQRFNPAACSLIGITHTVSTPPCDRRDAHPFGRTC